MQLTSIKFLNFRRFRQEEINLKSGFTIIFGKNWSWKSSIIDGIWFCLFGAWNKDFSRGVTLDFKSYFLNDRKPSKIELNFVFSWDQYRVVRIIDKGIKKFENDFILEREDLLFWPKSLKIVWWTEITNFLIKLFWVSREIFLKSVFTKQKDLSVFSWDKSARKSLINSILWIDKLEKIIRDFSKCEYSKKTELRIIKSELENFDLEKIKKELIEFSKQKTELEKQEKEFKKQLEEKKKEFFKQEKEFKIQEKIKENFENNFNLFEKIKIRQENLKKNIENIKEELKNLEEKKQILEEKKYIFETEKILKEKIDILKKEEIFFKQKQILEKEKIELEKKIREIFLEIKSLSPALDSMTHKGPKSFLPINEKGATKENIEKNLEEKNKNLKEILQKKFGLEKELEIILEEWKQIKNELEEIKKLASSAKCPTCKRELWDYAPNLLKIINEKREEKIVIYNEKKKKIKELEIEEKNLWEKILELEKIKNDLEEAEKKLIRLQDLEKNKKENIDLINKKLLELKNINFDEKILNKLILDFEKLNLETKKLRILEWEIKKIDILKKDLKDFSNDLEQKKLEKKDLEKNLEEINFDKQNFLKLKLKQENFNKIILEKTEKLWFFKDEINVLDKQIFIKNTEKENNKQKEKRKNNILKDLDLLNLKQRIFSDYSIYLLNFLKPKIEFLASNYFATATNNKYTSISLDTEYRIKIDEKSLDLYSWGEQDLANLCLRIALGQNLSITNTWNLINFLILDEVLWSQDKVRQENILLALKKLETKFSQIILISHIDDLKDIWDNLIEVKSLDNFESEIVSV